MIDPVIDPDRPPLVPAPRDPHPDEGPSLLRLLLGVLGAPRRPVLEGLPGVDVSPVRGTSAPPAPR